MAPVFLALLLSSSVFCSEDNAAITEGDVVRSSPWASLGSNYYIIWRTHQALELCQIAIGNGSYRSLPPQDPIGVRAENAEYYGRGLWLGDCGFIIRNITEDHHGPVYFRAYPEFQYHATPPIVLSRLINVAVPPKGKPHLSVESVRDGDTLNACCEVEGGRPEPVFEWSLNKRLITKEIEKHVSNADSRDVKYSQHLRLPVNWTQNGILLNCHVSHMAWKNYKENTFTHLSVTYSPREMEGPIHLNDLVIGESENISIDVQANPRPEFTWTVDDVIVEETMAVEQKLVVWPIQHVVKDTWRAILTVKTLTDADLNRNYSLRARNAEGEAIYNVKIFEKIRTTTTEITTTTDYVEETTTDYVTEITAATEVPVEETFNLEPTKVRPTATKPLADETILSDTEVFDGQRDETGLGCASITGIVIAILVMLVLLLVCYGWTTKRWCFVVKSKTNTHDDVVAGGKDSQHDIDASSDTESVQFQSVRQVPNANKIKLRVPKWGSRKKSQKTPTENHVVEYNVARETRRGVAPGQGDFVVYAQLDLTEPSRPLTGYEDNAEKTIYAELVHNRPTASSAGDVVVD